ncbi:OLC1v1033768C2 [Oldenlandia corymbosa var. corymbosa]|nr:OLC1v1033768C2 [Oldenlandia corymbosa var. corymbosa]
MTSSKQHSDECRQLPEDVIEQVLVRLPCKTVLRFRCVSRRWKAIIQTKFFVNQHLAITAAESKSNPNITRVLEVWEDNGSCIHTVTLEPDMIGKLRTKELDLNHPFGKHVAGIHGCCNGLICLTYSEYHTAGAPSRHRLLLWNPSIRKYWELRQPIRFITSADHKFDPASWNFVYGFGYDDLNDDYKVVKVVESSHFGVRIHQQVGVYSRKLNSWKLIEKMPTSAAAGQIDSTVTGDGKLVNNALHWIIDCDIYFVAFDLRTDTYRMIPQPDEVMKDRDSMARDCSYGDLQGCLYVMYGHKATASLHLWIMKDYGVKDSWTKIVVLEDFPRRSWYYPKGPTRQHIPIAYIRGGGGGGGGSGKVFFDDRSCVYGYDIETQTFENCPPYSSFSLCVLHGEYSFISTLVDLDLTAQR